MKREHGGPDARGVPMWDFSTNANSCDPYPQLQDMLKAIDARHYPDASYQVLRYTLAAFHHVDVERVVLATSASEFIMRLTSALARIGAQRVWLPEMSYGEYAHAAQVWNFQRVDQPERAQLCWLCEPSSPLGVSQSQACDVAQQGGVVVLDRAYEPLRLSGACSLDDVALTRVWQLWSPNKSLGLTGIRGAYAIAPESATELTSTLVSQTPSWPLGSHAVAMLMAWPTSDVQAWLAQSKNTLRIWKTAQIKLLSSWACLPSDANFFCMKASINPDALRTQGIKLRNTSSFGLPGHWRLSVQPPDAQHALLTALEAEAAV